MLATLEKCEKVRSEKEILILCHEQSYNSLHALTCNSVLYIVTSTPFMQELIGTFLQQEPASRDQEECTLMSDFLICFLVRRRASFYKVNSSTAKLLN